MKDKVKGLVLGITIGSLLTGTGVAMAANTTSIQVAFKQVGLYIDQVKKSDANVIIYKGTTYVPARTMSNAMSKDIRLSNNNLYIGSNQTNSTGSSSSSNSTTTPTPTIPTPSVPTVPTTPNSNSNTATGTSAVSRAQAIQLVKDKYKLNGSSYLLTDVDHEEDDMYVVHVYEDVVDDEATGEGHTSTYGWYYVNKNTGEITSMF
ncbi:hypothetical protein PaeCFBP13512_00075 [Paenibacillus sp. CFBP13512]|uniref:hypothetical protein n=1 Tax=Paenibacillus sp. CFBP13512 TaxID=2184007 RepID=UPI0010BFC266|nr:hypothetical protein [Paenibacillus sp. CFBP13512]TKJ93938.1 hypothetical protein PaeCFBP13512_00075 [Paenibacillus sp. CFBP13512]